MRKSYLLADSSINARKNEIQSFIDYLDRNTQSFVELFALNGAISNSLFGQVIAVEGDSTCFPYIKVPRVNHSKALADKSAETVINFVNLHHMIEIQKLSLIKESQRLATKSIVFAEVHAQSFVADFMRGFVNTYGVKHEHFETIDSLSQKLINCGLNNLESEILNYTWDFVSLSEAVIFMRAIFELSATNEQIINALIDELNLKIADDGGITIDWSLFVVKANIS